MLGIGDVDYMDYNISYDTIGALGQRMWVRGLYAYPAIPGKTTVPAPDLATGRARISNGGLDLHGHDPERRAVGHLAVQPGDRRGRGPWPEAVLQPGRAVRRPA